MGVDEADEDKNGLEQLFANLISKGHQITVEYDSAGKWEQVQYNEYVDILIAGKKLSIHGREIESIEGLKDYWRARKKYNSQKAKELSKWQTRF